MFYDTTGKSEFHFNMNPTDFFLKDGQLNWIALSTIVNFILTMITIWQANEVRKLTIKDKIRPRILEEIRDVLTSSIHSLEKEIEAIQRSKIKWYRNTSGISYFQEGISKLLNDDKKGSDTFRDVIEKFPDLEKKFHSHDNLYDKLNDLYAKIEEEIKTPEIIEHLETLINEFNKSRDETHKLRGEFIEKPYRTFMNFIINFKYQIEPDVISSHIDFWKEYKEKILKFSTTPQIKHFTQEIDYTLTQLKKLNEELLDRMKTIREDYRKEYHFTKYEIDPEQKEKDEWKH
jgi:hypothetical protein